MADIDDWVEDEKGTKRRSGSSGSDKYAPKKDFSAEGKGLGKKSPKLKSPMPKQADYGDTRSFGEALRKWREAQASDTDATAQKNFLKK